MNWRSKLLYSHNWNIGFCEQTPEDIVQSKSLNKIQWMKHPYRDRWFADPFILKVTEEEIFVFVEECPIDNPKGIICELVIDRKNMRLKDRHVMLELDTHLSYPAIIRHKGKVYVYPENGASGKLNIYEYDAISHRLVNPVCILNEAVADATLFEYQGQYIMVTTKYPNTQEQVFLYYANSLFGPFVQMNDAPIQSSHSCSRPGGNWFFANKQLFRPAQDCTKRYGSALSIMKVSFDENKTKELKYITLRPKSFIYDRGLHTINFKNGLCVIDGYGYLFPCIGHAYDAFRRIKHKLNM